MSLRGIGVDRRYEKPHSLLSDCNYVAFRGNGWDGGGWTKPFLWYPVPKLEVTAPIPNALHQTRTY